MQNQFLAIDEEGYLLSGETRLADPLFGQQILQNIFINSFGAICTKYQDNEIFIEAFDAPYVAQHVDHKNNNWSITTPYDFKAYFKIDNLSLDEWDRFHGVTNKGIPFVLSRKAQAEFINLIEDYTDEEILINDTWIPISKWLDNHAHVESEKFWSDLYKSKDTGWDLNQPAPALKDMLPRLKLPKSKVLVLGSGRAHDAALFAELGHVVTAVDISPDAIAEAKKLYGHYPNLNFMVADALHLPQNMHNSFDIVFEQTCFCAINPSLRSDLVKAWRKYLHDQGMLLGIFFVVEKPSGPPFGGSEWEIRQRLKEHFQFLFWGRWKNSVPKRQGRELFVYAKKKALF